MNLPNFKTALVATGAPLILGVFGGAAQAGHANPWAGVDDVVQEQYHDTNQSRSIGTPGQDEMKGLVTQDAFGKTEGAAGNAGVAGAGQGGGHGAGGGHGQGGGAGHGARN